MWVNIKKKKKKKKKKKYYSKGQVVRTSKDYC